MIITPLGHTEFLIDIKNKDDENVRILVDSWLSDFGAGDLMERSTKIKLDREIFSSINAIYISHSHTDHLDPYTIVEIFKCAQPLLIIPFTLEYLVPLIHEFLGSIEIHILKNSEPFLFRGIEIRGYMFPNENITNEDDVMMIGISNEKELLFAEIDSVPDEYSEEVAKSLREIFTRHEYITRCYIASRNELEGQIPSYDLTEKKYQSFRSEYIAGRKEEMRASYEKYEYEEYVDFPNIFTLPGFCRGFVGQGLCYPWSMSESLSKRNIFPLEEIASMESDLGGHHGYEFSQKALLPGRQYIIENGTIEKGRKECPIGEIVKNEEGTMTNTDLYNERRYASGPLFPRENIDLLDAKSRILKVLNYRFLPYWSASPVASLREALIKNNGIYRIELKLGNSSTFVPDDPVIARDEAIQTLIIEHGLLHSSQGRKQEIQTIIFEYSTRHSDFREISYTPDIILDEEYFIEDILDFLEGKQDLYSNFWHKLDPKKTYRLWMCLGANFCNNDLVLNKYRLHFQRAVKGETSEEWMKGALKNIVE